MKSKIVIIFTVSITLFIASSILFLIIIVGSINELYVMRDNDTVIPKIKVYQGDNDITNETFSLKDVYKISYTDNFTNRNLLNVQINDNTSESSVSIKTQGSINFKNGIINIEDIYKLNNNTSDDNIDITFNINYDIYEISSITRYMSIEEINELILELNNKNSDIINDTLISNLSENQSKLFLIKNKDNSFDYTLNQSYNEIKSIKDMREYDYLSNIDLRKYNGKVQMIISRENFWTQEYVITNDQKYLEYKIDNNNLNIENLSTKQTWKIPIVTEKELYAQDNGKEV